MNLNEWLKDSKLNRKKPVVLDPSFRPEWLENEEGKEWREKINKYTHKSFKIEDQIKWLDFLKKMTEGYQEMFDDEEKKVIEDIINKIDKLSNKLNKQLLARKIYRAARGNQWIESARKRDEYPDDRNPEIINYLKKKGKYRG